MRPAPRLVTLTLVGTLLVTFVTGARAFSLASVQTSRDASARLWVAVRLERPIEGGVARAVPATVDLSALVEQLADDFRPAAEDRGQRLDAMPDARVLDIGGRARSQVDRSASFGRAVGRIPS